MKALALKVWDKIDWLNGVLRRFQQYFSYITATIHIIHPFLIFTSTRLGSEVSYPRTLPRKNPEDPVRLEPRTPGLRVKHFTTEPCGTQVWDKKIFKNFLLYLYAKSENPQHRTNFYSRAIIWSILVEGHYMMLHAKYESFSPYSLVQEDF